MDRFEPNRTRGIGRDVAVRAWCHDVKGIGGHVVPVLLLDTGLQESAAQDRGITDHLYGGDSSYRLTQEAVLGIAGVRMLRALGYARPHFRYLGRRSTVDLARGVSGLRLDAGAAATGPWRGHLWSALPRKRGSFWVSASRGDGSHCVHSMTSHQHPRRNAP